MVTDAIFQNFDSLRVSHDPLQAAAHVYCGHQFGNFAGQLGDGAAMYLGDLKNPNGERMELQFKGAGKTPCSRDGDGRKVLRSDLDLERRAWI